MAARLEFDTVFNWDGVGTSSGDYTDVTLESQSPAGTSFPLFNSSANYLYLGNATKFDMAIFDIDTVGSLGALTWQYYNGSAWTTFVPASARYETDVDDNEGGQFDFSVDGVEIFPQNILSDWATVAINSATKYYVRVTAASVTTSPTIKRIQMRPLASYCTTKDVYELLQLKNVTSGTDFTSSTVPSLATVEQAILNSQSYIDSYTRKSWRPNYVANEYHQFNINGIKLDSYYAYKVLSLKIWNGSSWDTKTQGRASDYFLVPDAGMIQFARYFTLPAKFTTYNAPIWRWGGGEFSNAVKIRYLSGHDITLDVREGNMVADICTKLSAIEVVRTADFGGAVVSGLDRMGLAERVASWEQETANNIDNLKAFEVF